MIEYGFTEEQEMFRQEMRRFARRELAPLHKEGNMAAAAKKAFEGLKLNSLNYPERVGGWKLDRVSVAILAEELYMAGSMLGGLPFETTFNGEDLAHLPDQTQDEIALGLINRTATLRHGYTEANSGNEQAAIRTRAVRQGEFYIINGEKQPASGCAGSTYSVITAVTDPAAGHKGISQFLVPRNSPGVSASLVPFPAVSVPGPQSRAAALGGDPQAASGCVICYDDVKVPVRYRLGEEGTGLAQLELAHNWASSIGVLLPALCNARLSLDDIIEYTGKRAHWGSPIIRNQGISFEIAEHYTNLEAAMMLLYRAMWVWDQGRGYNKEVAMAKFFGMAAAERSMLDCLRIGGYTYWSTESPLPGRLISTIGVAIADGPAHIQRLRILREIAPDAFPPGMAERFVS